MNQIYIILTELQNLNKNIIICKFPAHVGIKDNKDADKTAKKTIHMTGMATIRLPYTDYYLTIKMPRNFEKQKNQVSNT